MKVFQLDTEIVSMISQDLPFWKTVFCF